jgi:16S rRNA (cytosine967-C5)-methyltransferase
MLSTLSHSNIKVIQHNYFKLFFKVVLGQKNILDNNLFQEGIISIQDPAAGAVVELVNPQKNDFILDVCAAPGTKSLFMAQRVGQGGKIFACDNSQTRIDKALKDKSRHRLNNIEWHLLDASKDKYPLHEKILLDVPCSGTGVIGRRPDIKWRLRKSDIQRMANLQKSILKNISNYLKPGGKLVYSTCSLEREENQDVIDHFLKFRSDFELIGTNSLLPDRWVSSRGFMFSFPAKTNTDGLFAAVLRKKI